MEFDVEIPKENVELPIEGFSTGMWKA